MAHIRECGTGKQRRYILNYRLSPAGTDTRARLKTLDEAMLMLWRAEISEWQLLPAGTTADAVPRWTVRKAVWCWLGSQYEQVGAGTLAVSSYQQYSNSLLTLPEDVLRVKVGRLTPLIVSRLSAERRRYLRQVFSPLVAAGGLTVNPVGKQVKIPEKKISIPEKTTLRAMLAAAGEREQIAILLGCICGLRVSELVGLRYSDVSREKIVLCRHVTKRGERAGTKNDPEGRTVAMPSELWARLYKSLLGSDAPVISDARGRRLSLNYSTQGAMRELLTAFGIGRYHDLRHFAITNLMRKGVAVADVARFAGHKDSSVTLRKYAHFLQEPPGLDGMLEG
ncbi:tyrosine-type recombinase/integrase [Enterobacter mori]|uniref:tyrosine-type recombinase/integrase n=1 Tax=Enterobacter mori TaxID=539813 RepID=UPI003B84501D